MAVDPLNHKKPSPSPYHDGLMPVVAPDFSLIVTQAHFLHLFLKHLSHVSFYVLEVMQKDIQKNIEEHRLFEHLLDKKSASIHYNLHKFIERIQQNRYK